MKRAILTAVSLVLVAGGAAACGGSPKDASTEDFCKAWTDASKDDNASGKDIADKVGDVGTPKDASDSERHGYEVFLKLAKKDDGDKTDDEMKKEMDDLSDGDKKDVEAFFSYEAKTCMPDMPDMSDAPTN